MKRRFLLISMCAAVMFFSSCSKEDNTVDTKEVNNQTEVNATKAITVSAKQKSSVSKVALGDKNSANTKYEEVFSEGEVLKLYLNGDEIASLDIQSGQRTTSATFTGEIPLSADGKSISAKILPKDSPSELTECSSFAAAVSTYASLYGTFTYNASADNFAVTLYDEVSYFVVETNMSAVDINGNDYTVSNNSVVFAFKENQTVSSTKLGLNSQALAAGGNVYFKTVNVVTGITLNKTSTTIVDASETLTATISPANATNNSVTWTSSNTDVATVNENGEVTAVASGTAIITATANDGSGVYRECYVRVESNASATPISDLDHLYESGKYILQNDIEVEHFLIDPNTNIDIDLNGHTITTTKEAHVDNATLTLRGSGTIYCAVWNPDPENPSYELRHNGFSLNENAVLNLYGNVTITNARNGVALFENSVLNICDNVKITNDQTGVFVMEASSKINMYGGTITGCDFGVSTAGSQNVLNNQGGTISGNTLKDIE